MRIRRYPGRAVDASLSLDQTHALDNVYQHNWLLAHEAIRSAPIVATNQPASTNAPSVTAPDTCQPFSSALGKYQMTLDQLQKIETFEHLSIDSSPKLTHNHHHTLTANVADSYSGYRPSTLRRKNRKQYPGWDQIDFGGSDTIETCDTSRSDIEQFPDLDRKPNRNDTNNNCSIRDRNANSSVCGDFDVASPPKLQRSHTTLSSTTRHTSQHEMRKPIVGSLSRIRSTQDSCSLGNTYTGVTSSSIVNHRDPGRRMRNHADNALEPHFVDRQQQQPSLEQQRIPTPALILSCGGRSSTRTRRCNGNNNVSIASNVEAVSVGDISTHASVSDCVGVATDRGDSSAELFVIPRPRLIVPVHSYARKRRTGNLSADTAGLDGGNESNGNIIERGGDGDFGDERRCTGDKANGILFCNEQLSIAPILIANMHSSETNTITNKWSENAQTIQIRMIYSVILHRYADLVAFLILDLHNIFVF